MYCNFLCILIFYVFYFLYIIFLCILFFMYSIFLCSNFLCIQFFMHSKELLAMLHFLAQQGALLYFPLMKSTFGSLMNRDTATVPRICHTNRVVRAEKMYIKACLCSQMPFLKEKPSPIPPFRISCSLTRVTVKVKSKVTKIFNCV